LQKFAAELLKLASRSDAPAPVRTAAFQSLRDIGGSEVVDGLNEFASGKSDVAARSEAVKALVALDLQKGVQRSIDLLPEIQSEDAALGFWRAVLANKGAAPAFAQALPKSGLPAPVVKAGLRVAREGGRNEPNLVLAL